MNYSSQLKMAHGSKSCLGMKLCGKTGGKVQEPLGQLEIAGSGLMQRSDVN